MGSPVERSPTEGSPRLAEIYERKILEHLQSEAEALEQKRIQEHEERLQMVQDIPRSALSGEIDPSDVSALRYPSKFSGLGLGTQLTQEPEDMNAFSSSSQPTDSAGASPETSVTSIVPSSRGTPLPKDSMIEVLRYEIGKVKHEVGHLRHARDERNEQIKSLQEQLNEAQKKYHHSICTVRDEIRALSETVGQLRQELVKTRRERDEYAKEARQLQGKEARLNDELYKEKTSSQNVIQESADKEVVAKQEQDRLLMIIAELSRQEHTSKKKRPAEKVIQKPKEPGKSFLELDPLDVSSMHPVPADKEALTRLLTTKPERKSRKPQMYTGNLSNTTGRKWRKTHDSLTLPGGTLLLG
ncbi:hypothetical protein AOQ84DRAFT_420342 [Glonium stellatum]|uniref:Uncharacterized protein n=1 Tax=Glonium stellatum TaxID=574774 RepID=A0A8E2F802_9PEZI|nr:hypothetical protein AOQ84DRAFT_420342 [Glonium stellatum]